jgi:MerR family transcriptional regulator, thiopeptide resistance regulator
MRTYSISKLARLFDLSRSTLLYYDRIDLLPACARTESGYRVYTQEDAGRLERICRLRRAGLCLEDIRSILSTGDQPSAVLLENRLKGIGEEILELKVQQGLLLSMLKGVASKGTWPQVDKQMWVEMLRAAGMDEAAMARWHAEFERRAPEEHHSFLLSLSIPEREVERIREWSRKKGTDL